MSNKLNNITLPPSVDWLACTIPLFLEKVAEINPDQIAIESESDTVTYAQLNQMSNYLAFKILDQLPESNHIVIISSSFIDSLVAQFAVLKAGKTAAILVANWPVNMLSQTIEQLDCELILTSPQDKRLVQQVENNIDKVLRLQTITDLGFSDESPGIVVNTDQPAYVLFTSGSTSRPKGVIKSHQFIMHELLIRAEKYQMKGNDRVMITNDLFFGRTLFTTLSTLFGQSTLVLKDIKKEGIHTLPSWLIKNEITIFSPTGSMLRGFNAILDGNEDFSSLRIIRVGAEAVYESDLSAIRKCISDHCLIWVNYGSTETGSMCCNIFTREKKFDTPIIPVGRPFPTKSLQILDEQGHELPAGRPGQIVIKGSYLSSGYINHEEANQNKFVFDFANSGTTIYHTGDQGKLNNQGLLEINGRKDQMVKIRGYRVDLAFIEMQLNELAEVNIGAVTIQKNAGVDQVVAHMVLKDNAFMEKVKVKANKVLPDYMIPSRFVLLSSMPRLANGKIDRVSLSNQADDHSPRTGDNGSLNAVELEVKKLWDEVLEHNPFGVDENFFEIGGDSIAAAVMISELEKRFLIDLPSEIFWFNPTIKGLTEAVILRIAPGKENKFDPAKGGSNTLSENKMKRLQYLIEEVKLPESRARLMRERKFRYKILFLFRRFKQKQEKGLAISYLLNWIQEQTITFILNRLSYVLAVKVLSRLIARGLSPLLIQRKRRMTLRYFNKSVNPDLEKSQLHKAYLFYLLMHCNPIKKAITGLKNGKPQGIKFMVEGEHILNKAMKEGKGVLLLGCHSGAGWWSRVLDYEIFTLAEVDAILLSYGLSNYKSAVYASQLREVMNRLRSGGIVKIVADGDQGSGVKFSYQLAGFNKELFTGFAEVAIQTEATVIPVTPYMADPYQVTYRFEEPLDLGDNSSRHEERIRYLIRQYADVLEGQYLKYPWQMRLDHVLPNYDISVR